MQLIRLVFIALALCGPAFAKTTPDALRDMVMAGDLAAVEAAFSDATLRKSETGEGRFAQRSLFGVFSVTHPAVGTFTENWLQKNPTSSSAMTARGLYLDSMGWANRGEGSSRTIHRDGITKMQSLHEQAFSLFKAAIKADPALISASDGILRLATTVGSDALIPVELERIMSLYPGRYSLMLAMFGLAPQWGGTPKQVQLLCDRYAPIIKSFGDKDIGDYTPEVCVVDAVYFAGFQPGPMLDAARSALPSMTNPILDHARFEEAKSRNGPVADRLAMLEKAKADAIFTPDEVFTWWTTNNEATNSMNDGFDDPRYKLAISEGVDMLRSAADQDPLRMSVVYNYIDQHTRHVTYHTPVGDPAFVADAIRRLQVLLTGIPHNASGWGMLAKFTRGEDISYLEKSVLYHRNAIFYSNYSRWPILDAIADMTLRIDGREKMAETAGSTGLSQTQSLDLDRIGKCPLLAFVRLADAVCSQDQMDRQSCLGNADISALEQILADIEDRGVCQTEVTASLEDLLFGPTTPNF